jgi:hypothetical protein
VTVSNEAYVPSKCYLPDCSEAPSPFVPPLGEPFLCHYHEEVLAKLRLALKARGVGGRSLAVLLSCIDLGWVESDASVISALSDARAQLRAASRRS